jgi:alkanesulfonate monooxygenase SsuD/methylene tetrahydromethanopterin reductase-like flavin-dependent oxidoreductase (luciferase family)
MEEGVAIIRKAWSGEPVQFAGKRFCVDALPVTPVPKVAPRLFIGGMAAPAIARAARLGDGFLSTGGIGHDIYVEALATQGKTRAQGAICAGHWGIIAADPEAEAAKVGPHVLYQINQYVSWGAFGPPEHAPLFPDAASAIRDGLYELLDGDAAVASLTKMLREYPEIVDVHFWAQFPGEPVDSGSARIEYIAHNVIPRVRANLSQQ